VNVFELLIFLSVTATVGVIIGGIAGVFTGEIARGAKLGALLGPIVVAFGITLYLFISKTRKSHAHKTAGKDDKKTE
jgi:hypothetical protein